MGPTFCRATFPSLQPVTSASCTPPSHSLPLWSPKRLYKFSPAAKTWAIVVCTLASVSTQIASKPQCSIPGELCKAEVSPLLHKNASAQPQGLLRAAARWGSLGLQWQGLLGTHILGSSLINAHCEGEGSEAGTSVRLLEHQTQGMPFCFWDSLTSVVEKRTPELKCSLYQRLPWDRIPAASGSFIPRKPWCSSSQLSLGFPIRLNEAV